MGCDIHSYVEVRRPDGAWQMLAGDLFEGEYEQDRTEPFPHRTYGLFGFLADVRNYSHVPSLDKPRGLPEDVSAELAEKYADWGVDAHSASWLTLAELLRHDYDQVFWDRRVIREIRSGLFDGAATAGEGEGRHLSLREFLGEWYFERLEAMRRFGDPGAVRIVFWFDN